jgi:hypothetical protein
MWARSKVKETIRNVVAKSVAPARVAEADENAKQQQLVTRVKKV